MICETCSCEMIDGVVVIHDKRKWLTSPSPCPDCMKRGLESMRQAGERLAQKLNAAAIKTLERTAEAGGVSPAEVVAALREGSEPPPMDPVDPVDASTAKLIETFGQDAADAIRSRNWPEASPPPPPG